MKNLKLLNALSLGLLYLNAAAGMVVVPFLLSIDIGGHEKNVAPLNHISMSLFFVGAIISIVHGVLFYFRWRANTRMAYLGPGYAAIIAVTATLFLVFSSSYDLVPILLCYALSTMLYPSLTLAFVVIALIEQYKNAEF